MWEPEHYTAKRTVYETVCEDVEQTCSRTVTETCYREETYTVSRPVTETACREETYCVQRPVWETQYRECNYTTQRQVWEDHVRECNYTVMQPVCETRERECRQVVMRPVTETIQQERCYTVMRPGNSISLRPQNDGAVGHSPTRDSGTSHASNRLWPVWTKRVHDSVPTENDLSPSLVPTRCRAKGAVYGVCPTGCSQDVPGSGHAVLPGNDREEDSIPGDTDGS